MTHAERLLSQSAKKAPATTVTPKGTGKNTYLAPDGLLDFKKLEGLKAKVTKALAKFSLEVKSSKKGHVIAGINAKNGKVLSNISPLITSKRLTKNSKTKQFTLTLPAETTAKEFKQLVKDLSAALPPVPTSVLALGIKAKFEKFNSSNHKKGTKFTYLGRRCAPVKERTKATAKMNVLLAFYAKGVLDKTLERELATAKKAFSTHIKAGPKVKERIGKAREVLKDQKGVALESAIAEIGPLLAAAGISEKNLVVGTSMMGQKTMYVKLPNSKEVITIGLSDIGAMNKAKKLSSQSSFDASDDHFQSKSSFTRHSGNGKGSSMNLQSVRVTPYKKIRGTMSKFSKVYGAWMDAQGVEDASSADEMIGINGANDRSSEYNWSLQQENWIEAFHNDWMETFED